MNKTAHLAMPSPYNFVSRYKGDFAAATSARSADNGLTDAEVLLCGHERKVLELKNHFLDQN